MNRLAAAILFIALLVVSGAIPTVKIISPVRQRQIKKLTVRQQELKQQIIQEEQDLQRLIRERQVFAVSLKTVNRKLISAVDDCESDDSRCDAVADLRVAVTRIQEKLSSIKTALSELKDPERVQRKQNELNEVSVQIEFLTKMLFPKPSVVARPLGR